MRQTPHHKEIEIKLRVEDMAAIRKRLRLIGARQLMPRTFESNTLFDMRRNDLRRRGQLLRIRVERPARSLGKFSPNENAAAILTYKARPRAAGKDGPADKESKIRKEFKVREELEVSVAGSRQLHRILSALGLHPVFRYEKVRTTYVLPNVSGLRIELDETPIGIFLELEGPVSAIHRAARLLGYRQDDYNTKTYGALYLAHCRRRRRKPGNMLFPQTKKLR